MVITMSGIPILRPKGTASTILGQARRNGKPVCGLSSDVNVCGKDQPQLSPSKRLKPETATLQKQAVYNKPISSFSCT